MTDNIIEFTGNTVADLPADYVLEKSLGQFESAIVIGRLANGDLRVFCNLRDTVKNLGLLEWAKLELWRSANG